MKIGYLFSTVSCKVDYLLKKYPTHDLKFNIAMNEMLKNTINNIFVQITK